MGQPCTIFVRAQDRLGRSLLHLAALGMGRLGESRVNQLLKIVKARYPEQVVPLRRLRDGTGELLLPHYMGGGSHTPHRVNTMMKLFH